MKDCYRVLFWIAVIIIAILLIILLNIKTRIQQTKEIIKETLNDVERIFYEMVGYIREAIIGGNTEQLKQQFEYSVDKLADAIKGRIPSVDVEKFKSIKQIIESDPKKLINDISSALSVPENKVSNFVTAIKSQIQNIKAGQNITATINHEDANAAVGEILSALGSRI